MRRSARSGSGISSAAGIAAVCFALILAACGAPAAPPSTSSPALTSPTSTSSTTTATASGSASGTATGSATATGAPTGTATGTGTPSSGTFPSGSATPVPSGWKTFTTSGDDLAFDHPGEWSIKDPAGESTLGGAFVEVRNAAGKLMATLRTNMVTGAECVEKVPFTVLDSEPMTVLAEKGVPNAVVPRYIFETRGDDSAPAPTQATLAAYGITMSPEEAGTLACPLFLFFTWPPSGATFGSGYNPENNTTPADPSLPYLQKAKLYVETGEYRNIRRMITSLRPAA